MYKKVFLYASVLLLASGCSFKQSEVAKSATIILKTPKIKFYDKGFIKKYDNKINLSIFNAGASILNLDIYENKICQGFFSCVDGAEFNKQFLSKDYKYDFLYKLLQDEDINFKDSQNDILIKILYDKSESNDDGNTK